MTIDKAERKEGGREGFYRVVARATDCIRSRLLARLLAASMRERNTRGSEKHDKSRRRRRAGVVINLVEV